MGSANESIKLREQYKIKKEEQKSHLNNFIKTKANITIEPTILLFVIAVITTHSTTSSLYLEKACRVTLKYGDEICNALKMRNVEKYEIEEQAVQKIVLSLAPWKFLIKTSLPCILSLFYGSWTDITGKRKWCMYMPIIGEIVVNSFMILNLVFFEEISTHALMVMEAVPSGLGGSFCIMLIGVYSYMSDITTAENRTFRMGLVSFGMSVAFPVGNALSGIVLKNLGFYGVYGLSASIHSINLLYCIFCVKNPPRNKKQKSEESRGIIQSLRAFFDISHIKKTFAVAFSRGQNNRRTRMMVILFNVCLVLGPIIGQEYSVLSSLKFEDFSTNWLFLFCSFILVAYIGEMTVTYIFTRFKFRWDEVEYSFYSTFSFIIHTIGTIFSITVFSKYLKFDDSVLGMISTMSKICGAAVVAFAVTNFHMYMGLLVEILNGTSLLSLRSIASKLVSRDELGRVNSLIGLCENVMPLVFTPLYSEVYTKTIMVFPGAIFLMSSALTIVAFSLFGWLFYEHRQNIRRQRQELAGEKKDNV